jgi:hypothetical protein
VFKNTANALQILSHQTLWCSVLVSSSSSGDFGFESQPQGRLLSLVWFSTRILSTIAVLSLSHKIVYCQWFESQPGNSLMSLVWFWTRRLYTVTDLSLNQEIVYCHWFECQPQRLSWIVSRVDNYCSISWQRLSWGSICPIWSWVVFSWTPWGITCCWACPPEMQRLPQNFSTFPARPTNSNRSVSFFSAVCTPLIP